MTDATLRIKNLSISLEALSRINGCRSEYDRVRNLLSEAIDEEIDKEEERSKDQPARSAKPFATDDGPSF